MRELQTRLFKVTYRWNTLPHGSYPCTRFFDSLLEAQRYCDFLRLSRMEVVDFYYPSERVEQLFSEQEQRDLYFSQLALYLRHK